jgi:hypothetical protein
MRVWRSPLLENILLRIWLSPQPTWRLFIYQNWFRRRFSEALNLIISASNSSLMYVPVFIIHWKRKIRIRRCGGRVWFSVLIGCPFLWLEGMLRIILARPQDRIFHLLYALIPFGGRPKCKPIFNGKESAKRHVLLLMISIRSTACRSDHRDLILTQRPLICTLTMLATIIMDVTYADKEII